MCNSCKGCGENTVYNAILKVYLKLISEYQFNSVEEQLLEAMGKRWLRLDRKPEEVLIGAIRICKGDVVRTVEPWFKFKDKA